MLKEIEKLKNGSTEEPNLDEGPDFLEVSKGGTVNAVTVPKDEEPDLQREEIVEPIPEETEVEEPMVPIEVNIIIEAAEDPIEIPVEPETQVVAVEEAEDPEAKRQELLTLQTERDEASKQLRSEQERALDLETQVESLLGEIDELKAQNS